LLLSQILTLFTTPVIYLYFDRLAVAGASDRAKCRSCRYEPVRPFHLPTGGHHAAELAIIAQRCASVLACCQYRRLPQIDFPVIVVSAASLPGADPETMASYGGYTAGTRSGRDSRGQ
jgi:hypothetical protein